ncbi:MAG: transposase [bacterium]
MWLKEYSQKYGLKIWAYCLMNNHVHFVCVPLEDDSLARVFNTLHMKYSRYFNNKKGLKGHLRQGRFFSCVLDEKHLYAAIRYVEKNPVKAGVVSVPESYNWSSAHAHVNRTDDPLLDSGCYIFKETKDWLLYLKGEDGHQIIKNIRKNSLSDRPCGDDDLALGMEALLGRKLKPMKRGRPQVI